jgi:putative alpha-1,2-mannosidase
MKYDKCYHHLCHPQQFTEVHHFAKPIATKPRGVDDRQQSCFDSRSQLHPQTREVVPLAQPHLY